MFFSATFLPVNYYKSLLSTKKDNYAIYADSTFDSKKRLLAMATDVSTRYTRRSRSEYERIAGILMLLSRKRLEIIWFSFRHIR